jgi:outer membrane protein assembly factor BamB
MVLAVAMPCGLAEGQVRIRPRPAADSVDLAVTFPTDRNMLKNLQAAQKLLAEGNYTDAVQVLGALIESPKDFFFTPEVPAGGTGQGSFVSIKAEALRLVGTLPAEGRRQYELRFGVPARQQLAAALAAGDAERLAQVAGKYFHTAAGYEAMWLLGDDYLDHDRPLAAALCFEKLRGVTTFSPQQQVLLALRAASGWLRAGLPAKAQETLAQLKQEQPRATVRHDGKPLELFARGFDALGWLAQQTPRARVVVDEAQWVVFRGNAARNAASTLDSPLFHHRWQAPCYDGYLGGDEIVYDQMYADRGLTELIDELSQDLARRNQPLVPAAHPLLVQDKLIMRTAQNLVAIDLRTGRRRWEGATDQEVKTLVWELNAGQWRQQPLAPNRPAQATPQQAVRQRLQSGLLRRIWSDATYGTLSSDGECVFCVEDVGFVNGAWSPYADGTTRGLQSDNRLSAYAVASGKRRWELTSVKLPGQNEAARPFFLGPPLPLGGRLFALVELGAELRLLEIDATQIDADFQPRVVASQPLCAVEMNILQDPLRRLSGASPSYADGILVCPTGSGAVVAFDLTSRSLLWAFTHERLVSSNPYLEQQLRGVVVAPVPGSLPRSWVDSSLTISHGRVLAAPPGANELYCLNLVDGSLVWKAPRDDGLYVGGVVDGKVVVVGDESVRALKLADGQPAWGRIALPRGARPAGRGYHSSNQYHLVLSHGELATVDLQSGRLSTRKIESPSEYNVRPANLFSCQGYVISQGLLGVDAFRQVTEQEVASRLQGNAGDAEAWTMHGEILLQQGRQAEAIESLRRAVAIAQQSSAEPSKARRLLTETLLDGLASDFATYRSAEAELAALADTPALKTRLAQLTAAGLHRSGEHLAACAAYLKLLDIDVSAAALQPAGSAVAVRSDRWLQGRLEQLRSDTPAELRPQLDNLIAGRFAQAAAADTADGLRRQLSYLGDHLVGNNVRRRLVELLLQEQDPPLLELEAHLLRLGDSPDAAVARDATARLAHLFVQAGMWLEAGQLYQRLSHEPLAEPADAKTGSQTLEEHLAALPASDRAQILNALRPKEWPIGRVEAASQATATRAVERQMVRVEFSPPNPFFEGLSFYVENGLSLVARTPWGGERWNARLIDTATQQVLPTTSLGFVASSHDHVFVLSTGYHVIAIDAAGTEQQQPGKILWKQSLTESLPGVHNPSLTPQPHCVVMPWGEVRVRFTNSQGQALGGLRPVVAKQVTFARGSDLVTVDSLSGGVLWIRQDLPTGCELFGDEELIFAVPAGSTTARVFRAVDGGEEPSRSVPPISEWMATLGSRIVAWQPQEGKCRLKLYDARNGQTLWEAGFQSGARAALADSEVGVIDAQGRFRLYDIADGELLIESPALPEAAGAAALYLFNDAQRCVAVISRSPAHGVVPGAGAVIGRIGGAATIPTNVAIIEGPVCGFDRGTGKLLYSKGVNRLVLPLGQPALSPVLAFVTPYLGREVIDNRRGARKQYTSVAFLDKRTGRALAHEKFAGLVGDYQVVANSAKKTAEFKSNTFNVTLTFSDEAWPADEAEPALQVEDEGQGPVPVPLPRPVPLPAQGPVPAAVPGPAAPK